MTDERTDVEGGEGLAMRSARRVARLPGVREVRRSAAELARSPGAQRARHVIEERFIRPAALSAMVTRTDNFAHVRWLGHPVWQNVTDAWLLQESLVDGDVDLVIECGTNRGGSSYFMGTIFDLLGRGQVITVDVEAIAEVEHPRVTYLVGDSTSEEVVSRVASAVEAASPEHVLVLLDSDHSKVHVERELERYAGFVGIGDYVAVQDGSIDQLWRWRSARPGPLRAIESFVARDDRFVVDEERSSRYLVGHSPKGWLRRIR